MSGEMGFKKSSSMSEIEESVHDFYKCPSIASKSTGELPEPDVHVITSGGLRIPVHSSILAKESPVLENILNQPPKKRKDSGKRVRILGVTDDAVSAFVRYLYTNSCGEEEMEKYGIHLLALSHVYMMPQLKQSCIKGLGGRLSIENVVDVLQLSRLCDAPDLYLRCLKLVYQQFKSVQKTEGWKFLQENDPWLELQILQFIDETETRIKKSRKLRHEQGLYLQLSEAMECLEHICTEGCTTVGPYDVEPTKNKGPCGKFGTCEGVQMSLKHFARCEKRMKGGCVRCKRMWQLLQLHSSICDQADHCRVPLCRQFKLKAQEEKKGKDIIRWKILVKKVVAAKAISSLSAAKWKNSQVKLLREATGTADFEDVSCVNSIRCGEGVF